MMQPLDVESLTAVFFMLRSNRVEITCRLSGFAPPEFCYVGEPVGGADLAAACANKRQGTNALIKLPTIDTLTARCALKLGVRPAILSIPEKNAVNSDISTEKGNTNKLKFPRQSCRDQFRRRNDAAKGFEGSVQGNARI